MLRKIMAELKTGYNLNIVYILPSGHGLHFQRCGRGISRHWVSRSTLPVRSFIKPKG